MVNNSNEDTRKRTVKQGLDAVAPKPMKIGASTPHDFGGSNMTAYGGLLPVVTMLEKLQFQHSLHNTSPSNGRRHRCLGSGLCWR